MICCQEVINTVMGFTPVSIQSLYLVLQYIFLRLRSALAAKRRFWWVAITTKLDVHNSALVLCWLFYIIESVYKVLKNCHIRFPDNSSWQQCLAYMHVPVFLFMTTSWRKQMYLFFTFRLMCPCLYSMQKFCKQGYVLSAKISANSNVQLISTGATWVLPIFDATSAMKGTVLLSNSNLFPRRCTQHVRGLDWREDAFVGPQVSSWPCSHADHALCGMVRVDDSLVVCAVVAS